MAIEWNTTVNTVMKIVYHGCCLNIARNINDKLMMISHNLEKGYTVSFPLVSTFQSWRGKVEKLRHMLNLLLMKGVFNVESIFAKSEKLQKSFFDTNWFEEEDSILQWGSKHPPKSWLIQISFNHCVCEHTFTSNSEIEETEK